MLLVVTYDVNTAEPSGAQRLRQVAKLCERYGVRVQNSVFEVMVDAAQLTVLKSELQRAMEPEKDSIRFYRLGNHYQNKIDVLGKSASVEAGQLLLF